MLPACSSPPKNSKRGSMGDCLPASHTFRSCWNRRVVLEMEMHILTVTQGKATIGCTQATLQNAKELKSYWAEHSPVLPKGRAGPIPALSKSMWMISSRVCTPSLALSGWSVAAVAAQAVRYKDVPRELPIAHKPHITDRSSNPMLIHISTAG